jgi:thioredoxin-related protein
MREIQIRQTLRNLAILGTIVLTIKGTPAQAEEASNLWFAGTVNQAFDAARSKKQPLLLFYTAVWCPYCNEIKHAVFSRPEFQQLMRQVTPLMVDGDAPDATAVSERFKLTGFPTVVFFNSEGKELTRFGENLTMDEFETTFTSVVAANAPIEDLLSRAEKRGATKEEWRSLARFPWSSFKPEESPGKTRSLLGVLSFLSNSCPRNLIDECPLFSAELLSAAATASGESKTPPTPEERRLIARTKKSWPSHLDRISKSPQPLFAARSFFLNSSVDFVKWLTPSLKPGQEKALRNRLRQTLTKLRADPNLPLYHRLETWSVELELARGGFRKGEAVSPPPPPLVKQIIAAVDVATAEAQSPLVRQPTLGITAGLLWEVNERARAQSLLEQEIPRSDTPYYYQSTLARMAQESGDWEKALRWSGEAVATAQGRMTKPRWMVKDLLLRLKLRGKMVAEAFEADFSKRLNDYFAFIMNDESAFSGGNFRRTESLLEKLSEWSKGEAHQTMLRNWQRSCSLQPQAAQAPCLNAFAKLLTEPKVEPKP